MTIESPQQALDSLAWRVAEDGVQRHLDEVRELTQVAVARGVPAALVAVVLDPGQPAVARQRAFGAMARAVTSPREREVAVA